MEIGISDELNSIINYSREEAMRTGSYGIAPDHLFLGILRHRENSATDALIGTGADVEELKQFIDGRIFTNEHIPYSDIDKVSFSRGSQNVLSFTILEATKLRSRQAASQHLLLALIEAAEGAVKALFDTYRITKKGKDVAETLKTTLSIVVKERAYNAAIKMVSRFRNTKETDIKISREDNKIFITCSAIDNKTPFMSVKLLVSDEEQAVHIKEKFLSDPTKIYSSLIDLLTK